MTGTDHARSTPLLTNLGSRRAALRLLAALLAGAGGGTLSGASAPPAVVRRGHGKGRRGRLRHNGDGHPNDNENGNGNGQMLPGLGRERPELYIVVDHRPDPWFLEYWYFNQELRKWILAPWFGMSPGSGNPPIWRGDHEVGVTIRQSPLGQPVGFWHFEALTRLEVGPIVSFRADGMLTDAGYSGGSTLLNRIRLKEHPVLSVYRDGRAFVLVRRSRLLDRGDTAQEFAFSVL
jgi:hypothetical protein